MTKKRRSQKEIARPLFEELEPRLLLSADLGGVLVGNEVFQDVDPQASDSVLATDTTVPVAPQSAEYGSRELVIIDAATPDYRRLLDDLAAERDDARWFDVVFLGADQDGVKQLTDILSGYSDLDAVHLISHGSDGSVVLGDSALDLDAVMSDARLIQAWGSAFSEDGDFLILTRRTRISKTVTDGPPRADQPPGPDVNATAAAMSDALAEWSREMAAEIAKKPKSG